MQGRSVVGWLEWRTRGAPRPRVGRSDQQEPYADHKLVTATNQNTIQVTRWTQRRARTKHEQQGRHSYKQEVHLDSESEHSKGKNKTRGKYSRSASATTQRRTGGVKHTKNRAPVGISKRADTKIDGQVKKGKVWLVGREAVWATLAGRQLGFRNEHDTKIGRRVRGRWKMEWGKYDYRLGNYDCGKKRLIGESQEDEIRCH